MPPPGTTAHPRSAQLVCAPKGGNLEKRGVDDNWSQTRTRTRKTTINEMRKRGGGEGEGEWPTRNDCVSIVIVHYRAVNDETNELSHGLFPAGYIHA